MNKYLSPKKYHGQGGQEIKRNSYCPTCHAANKTAHKEGCLNKKVIISATARLPKKNASEKVWEAFYKKFVLKLDLKEFNEKKVDKRRKVS